MLLLCLMGASIAEQPKIETRGGDITFKVSSVFSLLFFWIYTGKHHQTAERLGAKITLGATGAERITTHAAWVTGASPRGGLKTNQANKEVGFFLWWIPPEKKRREKNFKGK